MFAETDSEGNTTVMDDKQRSLCREIANRLSAAPDLAAPEQP